MNPEGAGRAMRSDNVSTLHGASFLVSDKNGDVEATPDAPAGLFHADMRHLSRWTLRVDGGAPLGISCDEQAPFAGRFWLVPGGFDPGRPAPVSIVRSRVVCGSLHERLTLHNHSAERRALTVEVDAAADFADLFDVKYTMAKKGRTYRRAEAGTDGDTLVLGYRREDFVRETAISANRPAEIRDAGLAFTLELPPGEHVDLDLTVHPVIGPTGSNTVGSNTVGSNTVGSDTVGSNTVGSDTGCGDDIDTCRARLAADHDAWIAAAPRLTSDWRDLERCYERSIHDLAALRFTNPADPDLVLPAAGLPWFMTLFGRDSALTSYFALPFVPSLAAATLRALAAAQGRKVDDFFEEDPGKILHEQRFGELAHFRDVPHSCYYGSVDATPLFLVLLEEYVRWTGDVALARELEPQARAALAWLEEHGDQDRDGYVDYERRNPESGIFNQCWKDSETSVRFADGGAAAGRIAICEVQGYAYDARRRCARLAREVWGDPAYADRLDRDADALRERFNRDFWLADRGYFALARDGAGRPVDSLTSNIGHLLWSGIVDEDSAPQVVAHLMGPRLSSGWGVRTMAVGDGAYNPIEYHNGTVWPHDTAIVAAGLARYGFRREAAQLIEQLVDAAATFGYRPPEVFAGYERDAVGGPAEYPTACSPQAWSSATFLLAVRLLLGLEPGTAEGEPPTVAPVLPDGVESVLLTNLAAPRPGAEEA
jgi:glycogen debranching enzyme